MSRPEPDELRRKVKELAGRGRPAGKGRSDLADVRAKLKDLPDRARGGKSVDPAAARTIIAELAKRRRRG